MRRVHREATERVGANRLGQNVGGPFPPFCGTSGLISIACSVQALPMNTTTHSVLTQPVGSHTFRCLPMNTTHSVASP